MLGLLFGAGALAASRQVPTCVLVAVPNEDARPECERIAAALRARGIATEVAPSAQKYGKQIRFAERRGIPFVWFTEAGQVRDIRSGEQTDADPASWVPPEEDLRPRVLGAS
jgi:histidyl-tRNA synthetase